MAKFATSMVLLVALVSVTVAIWLPPPPTPRQRGKGRSMPDSEPEADAVQPEADLKVTVNGEEAVLVCGDETKVEARRKAAKGRDVPLHEAQVNACNTLANVEDLTKELKPAPGNPCKEEPEAEEEVKIEGRFKGKQVVYERKFRNKCELAAVAPDLFDIKGEGELAAEAPAAEGRKKGKGKKGRR